MSSFAEGAEIVRVYLAGRLSEADAVERALDAAEITYAAETERYAAPFSLGLWHRTGVGFWVLEAGLDPAAEALERAGLLSGLVRR
jgi:hypothetical protein